MLLISVLRRVKLNFRPWSKLTKGIHENVEQQHRVKVENLLKRRFFLDQSFSIYGGLNGAYDYGPMGCAMKYNLLEEWRRFFVLEENMLQVDCSTLTPVQVMEASGHLTRFTDWMVKDELTGECYRVDHLIKDSLNNLLGDKKTSAERKSEIESSLKKLETMSAKEINEQIAKYGIKAPQTNNNLTEPTVFNLMFSTSIGPTGKIKGYNTFFINT